MNILELCNQCLMLICRNLDAESIVAVGDTCGKLRDVVNDHCVQWIKSYTCHIGSDESRAVAGRTLIEVGIHLTRIDITVDPGYTGTLGRFFDLLRKSVGQNGLIELSIFGELCKMPLINLGAALNSLETLTLHDLCSDKLCVTTLNVPLLCPNLRELIVSGPIAYAPNDATAMRRLETLDVTFTSQDFPTGLFIQNRQLTTLNLRSRQYTENDVTLSQFNATLSNLVKLHLDVQLLSDPIQHLPSLSNLPLLRSLELFSIPAALFDDILNILGTLDELRGIVLQCELTRSSPQFSTIQDSLPIMAAKLSELTSFVTISVDWTPDSVLAFVRHAQKLTYFDFWSDSNYTINPQFIRSLATARKPLMNIGMQPLHLKLNKVNRDVKEVFDDDSVNSLIKLAGKLSIL